ncbi:hypothetical protein MLD38_038432 [Melastoma candidum]|uniref:Uncharacterized protein n=1 Tax=Melastoma candidum TaxID=119954 RepID=A0ACB9KZI4_9MYRT|nr:hypothetical protein MLD38_038432 [Melastoma candidum]
MEKPGKILILALVLLAIALANGQTLCNMTVDGFMACKPSATPPNPSPPSGDCCAALSHANATCLCSYKKSYLLPSLGVDPNLAMQLPDKCKLPHPSQC